MELAKDGVRMKKVSDVRKILKSAERQGTEEDVPEGSRYIVLSDTLANQMAEWLTPEEPVVQVEYDPDAYMV